MPTVEEIRALQGVDVALRLAPGAGGHALEGRVVGTLDAADGMVVFIEPAGQPGGRLSYNYQHIATIERR
ncbi:MAG TPA: hypothetical protein VGO86_15675 [Candidatus Dormibacteraeota bacterium]